MIRIYKPNECAQELANFAQKVNPDTRCISGHISYGIHEYLEQQCNYFAILRNPVDRVISHYNFTRSQNPETHPLKEVVEFARGSSIISYLEHYPALANEQARMLSGLGHQSDDLVETAKNNITSNRIRIGFQDDFFNSLYFLFDEMSLGCPTFVWEKRRKNESLAVLDQRIIDEISDFCETDVALYSQLKALHLSRQEKRLNEQCKLSEKFQYQACLTYWNLRKSLAYH